MRTRRYPQPGEPVTSAAFRGDGDFLTDGPCRQQSRNQCYRQQMWRRRVIRTWLCWMREPAIISNCSVRKPPRCCSDIAASYPLFRPVAVQNSAPEAMRTPETHSTWPRSDDILQIHRKSGGFSDRNLVGSAMLLDALDGDYSTAIFRNIYCQAKTWSSGLRHR